MAAKLRPADVDAAAGAVDEVARIVKQICRSWPDVRIVLRADSGFARDELMAWCEANGVDFVFGLQQNERLVAEVECELARAEAKSRRRNGRPALYFKEFKYRTRRSWSREHRGIGKAEVTGGEANPRFVVTSPRRAECRPKYLYEKVYCARGDMENRIKECQLDLYADRTSTATLRANQLRLWFASMAYVLLCALRRIGLAETRLAKATCGTIRLKLLKNWSARSHLGSPHQDCNGLCLPRRRRVAPRRAPHRCGGPGPRLSRLTRVAATRCQRGITPRPTETEKPAPNPRDPRHGAACLRQPRGQIRSCRSTA